MWVKMVMVMLSQKAKGVKENSPIIETPQHMRPSCWRRRHVSNYYLNSFFITTLTHPCGPLSSHVRQIRMVENVFSFFLSSLSSSSALFQLPSSLFFTKNKTKLLTLSLTILFCNPNAKRLILDKQFN